MDIRKEKNNNNNNPNLETSKQKGSKFNGLGLGRYNHIENLVRQLNCKPSLSPSILPKNCGRIFTLRFMVGSFMLKCQVTMLSSFARVMGLKI